MRWTLSVCALLTALAAPPCALGQPDYLTNPRTNPFPYDPGEPKAKKLSLAKAAEYLDTIADFWMRRNSCGSCHANFAYLMARPLLPGATPLVPQTRQFLARRKQDPKAVFSLNDVPAGARSTVKASFFSKAERVGIAFALAWQDAHATDKLQPDTRQALRQMWEVQTPRGHWLKMGCGNILPLENDLHYPVVMALLAAAVAPEGYARSAEARVGLTRARSLLTMLRPPAHLHHKGMLLWASRHMDGLMTTSERDQTVRALLARQNGDGGWAFTGLVGSRPRPHDVGAASDGYGTAFAVFVLRQAGVPASKPEIARGVRWLRTNQRASGRWFTFSFSGDDATEGRLGTRGLYVQNLGTAFAVLALKACEVEPERAAARPVRRGPGLALRGSLSLE
jgi:squalene-hopene/tetraprenyl-beta-curcumene cyclase